MKISWLSNAPYAATGYGVQTKLITTRLAKRGHEVATTCFYGLSGGILRWNDTMLYPNGLNTYGNDIAAANAQHFGAKIIISLVDAWVLDPAAMQMGAIRWIPYFPVDSDPLPPPVYRTIQRAYKRIVFSKFGEEMTRAAGLDCSYIPHVVDTEIYKPKDRTEARARFGLADDVFVVGMVAANKGNPSRKNFIQQIEAFARFYRKRKDARLYIHAMKSENGENQGVNLPEFVRYLGIEEAVMFADPYSLVIGFPDSYMVDAFNAFDVFLNVAAGEGFGVPVLEAQACGCPVIVGDWTAMSELCFSGWKVAKADADRWWTPLAAWQYVPRVAAVADALNKAYVQRGNAGLREKARVSALAYDADKIVDELWIPYLKEVEADL